MTICRAALAVSKLKTVVVALVAVLAIPAVAEAASKLALPANGSVDSYGHVRLNVSYSCPASTSPEDAVLWLYSSQSQPNFAAGDTAVAVTCDGKRRRYRADLGPNIGDSGVYVPGTVFIEAFLGRAYRRAYVAVR